MNAVDVLIIGGGVSGLSCAIYTSKAGLNTVVLHDGTSQLQSVKQISNIPGQSGVISGREWLDNALQQARENGAAVYEQRVEELRLSEQPYLATTTDGNTWSAKYVVLAVNLGYPLLSALNLDVAINEHVPSRKIRKVVDVGYDGKSRYEHVYVTGLLADVPSQTAIAAGHGAFIGVQIASDGLGKPFMWHD